jgi:hypothetical protein
MKLRIERALRLWAKRLRHLFSRPRYQAGDLITIAEIPHVVLSVRRNWKYGTYFYRLGDNFSASESVVDFFNNN